MIKKILGIILIILIVGTLVGLYLSRNINKQQQAKRGASSKFIPSENLNSYTDSSGFSLSYSDDLRLDKKEKVDNTTYVDLKLIADKVAGSVSINITDTKLKNIGEWENKNAGGSVGREAMLGGIAGREFTIGERVVTAVIDQGALFLVEANLKENKDFWQKIYSQVVSSFTFTNTSPPPQDDVVFEGEEVVQ